MAAVAALTSYFASLGLNFVLVGESETLAADLVPSLLPEHIDHYEAGRPFYDTLPTPALKSAVDLINSIKQELAIILNSGAVNMRHICGAVSPAVAAILEGDTTPYGLVVSFGKGVTLTAYGSSTYIVPSGPPPESTVTDQGTWPVQISDTDTDSWVQKKVDECIASFVCTPGTTYPNEMKIYQQNSYSCFLCGTSGCTDTNSCWFTYYHGPGAANAWYLVYPTSDKKAFYMLIKA